METGQPKIWCSSSNAARQENLLLKRESAFCSSQSTGWMRPIHTGEGSLPDSAYRFTCSSYPQTPSQIHQNNVWVNNWAPWPVTSTHSKDSKREPGGPCSTVSGPYSLLISPGPSFHISEDETRPVNLSISYKVLYTMWAVVVVAAIILTILAALGKWPEGCWGPWQGSYLQLGSRWGWDNCQIPSWHVISRGDLWALESLFQRNLTKKKKKTPNYGLIISTYSTGKLFAKHNRYQ